MSILNEIVQFRMVDIARAKAERSLRDMEALALGAPEPLDFVEALERVNTAQTDYPALIAEVKRASPSRGDLAPGLDPVELARCYRDNGAAAISVLTENRHFKGSLDDLQKVVLAGLRVPVLRKDFILDAWQVYEARQAGADAILLIVACLAPAQLHELYNLATGLGMTVLIEVHDRVELETALSCNPRLIGINNRNLANFEVNLATTYQLLPLVTSGVCVVAESGIRSQVDARAMRSAGVEAILVGEALVTSSKVAERVRSLTGMNAA